MMAKNVTPYVELSFAGDWPKVGYKKTTQACGAIIEQIDALYAEMGALEDGKTKVGFVFTRHEDEVKVG